MSLGFGDGFYSDVDFDAADDEKVHDDVAMQIYGWVSHGFRTYYTIKEDK